MIVDLDLLSYRNYLNIKVDAEGKSILFDPVRKKNYMAMPEELIRQLCIVYLTRACSYPLSRIQVEKQLYVGGQKRRFDIVVLDWELNPYLIVECKSHKVKINATTLSQLALYNYELNAPFIWITNGPLSLIAEIDHQSKNFTWVDKIPSFPKSE